MKYRQFKDKVIECEKLASEDPGTYRRRVVSMMLLGYLYVGIILLLGLLGIASIVILMLYNRHHVNGAEIKMVRFHFEWVPILC